MSDLLNSAWFGVLFTLILYIVGSYLAPKIKLVFLNKFIIAVIIGIIVMTVFRIPYDSYRVGADIILFFLSPIIVLLAIPLYRNFNIISNNVLVFILGCLFAVVLNFVFIYIILRMFPLPAYLVVPMYTKSITGPYAMEVNKLLGGDPNIAVMMVSFAGLTSGFVGGLIIKVFKVKHTISKGLGLGAISHVVGTYVALEHGGEEANAVATTTLTGVGVITVILLPIVIGFVQ